MRPGKRAPRANSAASALLAAGTLVKVVQELLGHHSAAYTLDVYVHSLPGQRKDAAARMDALLASAAQALERREKGA